jgi:hypothetical protein
MVFQITCNYTGQVPDDNPKVVLPHGRSLVIIAETKLQDNQNPVGDVSVDVIPSLVLQRSHVTSESCATH